MYPTLQSAARTGVGRENKNAKTPKIAKSEREIRSFFIFVKMIAELLL